MVEGFEDFVPCVVFEDYVVVVLGDDWLRLEVEVLVFYVFVA